MQAELHIDGITIEEDLDALCEQLETLNTVSVEEARFDRLFITYDPHQVNANMIEKALGAAGADLLRMNVEEE